VNDESSCCSERCKTTVAYGIGLFGSFLLVGGLACLMNHYTKPAPVGVGRAKERQDNLKVYQAENAEALNNLAKDPLKDVVRLPINKAMELAVQEWKNPAVGRASLISRMEKASAKPPEKKSEFE
jgi:hypothetical protein